MLFQCSGSEKFCPIYPKKLHWVQTAICQESGCSASKFNHGYKKDEPGLVLDIYREDADSPLGNDLEFLFIDQREAHSGYRGGFRTSDKFY